MQWWGTLLKQERPFPVTRAGGLLVTFGAMNALQIVVFLAAWLAPAFGSAEYRRLALVVTPIQFVYGVLRAGVGLGVLRSVAWARRAGVVVAALHIVGTVCFTALVWGASTDVAVEPVFNTAETTALVGVLGLVTLADGVVIRDLIRYAGGSRSATRRCSGTTCRSVSAPLVHRHETAACGRAFDLRLAYGCTA